MRGPYATLLLDGETVERCPECGHESSCTTRGREDWRHVPARPGATRIICVCPECYAQLYPAIRKATP